MTKITRVPKPAIAKRSDLLKLKNGDQIKNYVITSLHAKKTEKTEAKELGAGGAGIVFLAEQSLHEKAIIKRAIKFFMYRDDIAEKTFHEYSAGISNKDFLNEIINISGFNHEHLVKVIDAGLYRVKEFEVPYIVTDFIRGPNLKQILDPIDAKVSPHDKDSAAMQSIIREKPEQIIEILIQIATGLKFLHEKKFLHCDIAPKNIFLKRDENYKAIVGDLGAGRSLPKKGKCRVIGTKSYMPPEFEPYLYQMVDWEKFSSFFPRWDLFAYAKTGLELLKLIPQDEHPNWIKPIEAMLTECQEGTDYQSIEAILNRLNWLKSVNSSATNVPELLPTLLTKKRRLIPIETLATTKRVQILTWHPALLRLAKVPQLTAARHTHPGAVHTRYEHSLGTMETMRRYLMNLVDQNDFQEHLNASKIETALLCALFSSLTRFPFSTIIRELRGVPDEIYAMFSKRNLLNAIFEIKDGDQKTLPDLVKKHFPNVDMECVKSILTDAKETFSKEDELIYSLLNCSLDVRVIDFVRRDSLHLGLSRHTFDLDDLLAHLKIHHHRLALSVTGVSTAEEIIAMRYTLFNRIYWNRPNRAFVAMLRHIILELALDQNTNKQVFGNLREKIITASEMDVLAHLEDYLWKDKAQNEHLIDLIAIIKEEGRRPFKVILEASPKEDSDLSVVCKNIREMNHVQTKELAAKLAKYIGSILPNKVDESKRVPLLIDIPSEPGSGNKLGDDILVIYPKKSGGAAENLSHVSGIIKGVNDSFEEYLCRLRILLHPEHCPKTKVDKEKVRGKIREYLLRTVQ